MPFQAGQSGNPAGRPRGARNKTSVLFEQLIEADAETVIRTVVERAKRGDAKALSWLWGIMLPARKGAPVEIDLPPLERPSDAPGVIAAIFAAACAGEISPEEGNSLTRMVEAYVRHSRSSGSSGAPLSARKPRRLLQRRCDYQQSHTCGTNGRLPRRVPL